MPDRNVEVQHPVVRQFFASFDDDRDAFRETLHPDIQWFPIEASQRPTYGIDAAMRDRDQWLDSWDEHRLVLEEAIEDGDDVVVCLHITGRGSSSGAEVDVRFYPQFKVRDGKIVYIYDHIERAAALEAAGPGQPAGSS